MNFLPMNIDYSKEDILQLIQNGENSSVEFKSENVNAESVAKEIVALANTQGGTILIGVEDNKIITGLVKKINREEWICNIARNNCTPSIDIFYAEIEIENKIIGIVHIPKGKDKPYQTNKNWFLIRVGSTNRVTTQAELLRMFQQSGLFHYDSVGIEKTSIADLNLTKIDNYFSRYQIDFKNESEEERLRLLSNTDILNESGNATVAGILIFGINPQRHLYNAGISFAHFKGREIDEELIDKQIVEGTLDFQIDATLSVIKNNLLHNSVIEGSKTIDTNLQYPEKVFRELIVNACVHRNYGIHGSRIRIFMFSDRIEFHSPGRLPNSVTIDKLTSGVSYSINPVIVKFMENLRYIDQLGRGLPMVYNETIKINKKVEFKELGEEFIVTLN